MQWTFGIVTTPGQEARVNQIIASIEAQNIPAQDYEILIVGNFNLNRKSPKNDNIRVFGFDETVKKGWITKKKNLIAEHAKFPHLCLMHDYIVLTPGWYENFIKFGSDWNACMNKVIRRDGVRYIDWFRIEGQMFYLDYNNLNHTTDHSMFLSGYYFCVKRDFLRQYPLDENRVWGEGEDNEWSFRVIKEWNLKCNSNSVVQLIKPNRFFRETGRLACGPNGEVIWDLK